MAKRTSADLPTLITRGWQASLNFFEPKEMTTLLLVSLNSVRRAVTPLFTYFSWLLLWGCYIDLRVEGNALFGNLWEHLRPMWCAIGSLPRIHLLTMMLITFVMMLCVRASLHAKQPAYFMRNAGLLIPFAPLYLLMPHIFVMPIFWFMAFFVLDAPRELRAWGAAVYNGFMLWLAYAPFVIMMGAVHGVLFGIHREVWDITFIEEHHVVAYLFKYSVSVLLYLFFVAMLGAFYTRVVAGNSSNKLFKKTI